MQSFQCTSSQDDLILLHTYLLAYWFTYILTGYQYMYKEIRVVHFLNVFMPPPLGAGGIMFSGCPSVRLSVRPSVRPKPEIPSFDLYMGPLVHPTNRNRFTACPSVRPSVRPSVCPSVRPERFLGICRRMHAGIGLKFYMLMYLDHLQNWLVYGYGLLIFLILALFWLSETGQILGFRSFPGERMEEMVWNCARRCILTTFRTD